MSKDIVAATASYEEWLSAHLRIVPRDLALKHDNMAQDSFLFLRATYYRWAQLFPQVCPKLAAAPQVLAVGDLHSENFGTWRDGEGRLVWGVNDFDEVWTLPYTNDLVRLATSLRLAADRKNFGLSADDACTLVLNGYREAVERRRRAFVLEERHPHLRELADINLANAADFWARLTFRSEALDIPDEPRTLLSEALPHGARNPRYFARVAGQGSLGRQRWVVVADLHDALIAREIKAAAPSACAWATQTVGVPPLYENMLEAATRCPDPFYGLQVGRWVVRRLAPACSRINMATIHCSHDRRKLLTSMGAEVANVHFGTGDLDAVQADLDSRSDKWLTKAAAKMEAKVRADWKVWRKAQGKGKP